MFSDHKYNVIHKIFFTLFLYYDRGYYFASYVACQYIKRLTSVYEWNFYEWIEKNNVSWIYHTSNLRGGIDFGSRQIIANVSSFNFSVDI